MFTFLFFFFLFNGVNSKERWDLWLFRTCTSCNMLCGHLYEAFNSVLFVFCMLRFVRPHQWSHVHAVPFISTDMDILAFSRDDFTESSVTLLEFFHIALISSQIWHSSGYLESRISALMRMTLPWQISHSLQSPGTFSCLLWFSPILFMQFLCNRLILSSASIDLLAYPWASLISPVNPDTHRFPWLI